MKHALLGLVALTISAGAVLAQDKPSSEQRTIERRATEAVIWGMPIVNYDLMRQEMQTKTAARENQVVYWGRPLDWHNQTLTPNPDTLYFIAFYNTKDVGPVVIEIPPAGPNGSLNANFVNVWQAPLADAGLLGDDKGKGAKFLILPPDYAGAVPEGYTVLRPGTYGGYGLIRSNLKSHGDADVKASLDYAKGVKVYPLSQAANPAPTVFTDAQDVLFDSTIRYDPSFFEHLNRVVQAEPWLDRDRVMIDQLRTLGIEKGKAYEPDPSMGPAMEAGIKEAQAVLEAKYDAGLPPYWPQSRWTFPAPPALIKAAQSGFADPNAYPVDDRGMAYSYAFVAIKNLGAGQFYLISIRDKDGQAYDGASTYRLTVPPNVPVEQYWSVTAYDRQTHALIKNMPRASRASNAAEVQSNPDGSVDIWFAPKAPTGKETNWVPTDPARRFELMFRLYGPKKEFFDKAWVLPDVEKVAAQ